MIKGLEKWYDLIVEERDKHLELAEKESSEYHFNVAHGLTEAIRLYDKSGLNEELNKFNVFMDELCKKPVDGSL